MSKRWTRRSVVAGTLALSTGCLRLAGSETEDEQPASEGDTTEGDGGTDATTAADTEGEATTTASPPTDAEFAFRYSLAGLKDLRVQYVSGPEVAASDLRVVVGESSVPWTDLGGDGAVESGDTVTLTGDADGLTWPVPPATPVTVTYIGSDEPTPLVRFNTGGSSAAKSVTPANTGRNADVVGGKRVERVWSTEVGRIDSQPAIRDGVVYVGTYNRKFHALSLETGEILWTFDAPAPEIVSDSTTIAATPAVTEDAVYVGRGNSGVGFRLDRETGEVDWRQEQMGMYSPTVVDGTVYGGGGAGVTAVDAVTGEVEWRREVGWVSEGAVAVADGRVVAAPDSGLVCLSADTGDEEWVYFDGMEHPPNPAVADGTVYAVGGEASGDLVALALEDGSEQWTYETPFDRSGSTPIVGPETVVAFPTYGGEAVAVAQSGEEERWSGANGAAVASNSSLYAPSSQTNGVAAWSLVTGQQLWRTDSEQSTGVSCPPAAAEGYVVYAERISDEQYQMVALRERT
jgi:outer membrane protein assembly factor BamB